MRGPQLEPGAELILTIPLSDLQRRFRNNAVGGPVEPFQEFWQKPFRHHANRFQNKALRRILTMNARRRLNNLARQNVARALEHVPIAQDAPARQPDFPRRRPNLPPQPPVRFRHRRHAGRVKAENRWSAVQIHPAILPPIMMRVH
jgi:hypothetical protein